MENRQKKQQRNFRDEVIGIAYIKIFPIKSTVEKAVKYITNPKKTKLIHNIDEYRAFMKKHIELQKKQIVEDRIKELSEDFE